MTGRERIRAVFDGQPTDRLPAFEQAIASDVAGAILGRPVATGCTMFQYQEAAAWMRGEAAHDEFVASMRQDVIDLHRAFEFDMLIPPWRQPWRPTAQIGDWDFVLGDPDGDHEIWRYNPDTMTFGRAAMKVARPVLEPEDLEPTVAWYERQVETDGPYVIPPDHDYLLARAACPDLEVPAPAGLSIPLTEVWLAACLLRRDLVERYLDALAELTWRQLQAWAKLGFWLAWAGGDLADNHGPVYGPRVFREIVMPRVRWLTDRLATIGMKYVYRTDGDLWSIADEFFIGCGAAGYGEIDHDAGMTVPAVRRRYPHIVCWGDVPSGSLLHRGSEQQIRDFVRRRIDDCGPLGGWMFGSSNSIMPGTPPRNFVAMYEAARGSSA